jgi:hypothetical protein
MYTLSRAASPFGIKEQEYGISKWIKFTFFDSCLGVVSRLDDPDMIIGIHLVLTNQDNQLITPEDVTEVGSVLRRFNYRRKGLLLMGQLDVWEDNFPQVFQRLRQLGNNPETRQLERGRYGAKCQMGRIQVTY